MEAKGLRVNMPKTKVMICAADSNPLKDSGKYPCAVCRMGTGSNSILCNGCNFWVHKKCSGIKGKLKPDPEFLCSRCLGTAKPIDTQLIKKLSIGEDTLDVVATFCYLGDMVSQGGGCLEGITTRIRCAWNKFRQLLPLLTSHLLPYTKKGEMFCIYIRKVLLHASECWAPTVSDTNRLQRCDRSMIRWMCNVKWSEQVSSVSLLEKLMIPSITSQVFCLTKVLENVLQVDLRKLGHKQLQKISVIGICQHLLKTDLSGDPQCGKTCNLVTRIL